MALLSRNTCRLLGCCHLTKNQSFAPHNKQKRLRHERWGEVREERDSLRSAPQNNLLLDLLASNKQMVNSKDPFFMMDYLMKNIVYEDEHMVAFNKPMGFPLTYNPSKNMKQSDMRNPVVSLDGLLPELARRLCCSTLHVTLPLDRAYSGVIILTKSENYDEYLRKRFESLKTTNQQPYQHWDVLCVGIPEKLPKEKQKLHYNKEKFQDIYLPQTVFCNPSKTTRRKGNVFSTTLSGEIIGRNEEKGARSSHVRISITSASNHVIPAYLSERFAPVLGDQEYFWRAATVMGKNIGILKQIPSAGIPRPQELSRGILHNLEIKQGHVQNLPAFLHRSAVDIVHLSRVKKDPFQIQAALPDFFQVAKYRLLREEGSEAEFSEKFKKRFDSLTDQKIDKFSFEDLQNRTVEGVTVLNRDS
ncbi:uncharacterized protein LOC125656154 [Ostrea edulis]|uniref:uncharacterized protein LOC125656154 n=1 Tax=Ostrea edulis TaxID=37623 RepID=UPI002094DF19|nr:uncharacterized protein LOC125656154 [Ostrea edulis]